MLSLKLYGPNDIRLVETEVPVINDNELLLKTDAAAICGTDIRMWQNGYKGVDEEHPLILGHEFSGTIVKAGKNVPFYKEGMQVAIQPNIGCGICERCVSGNFHLCDDYRAFGINMDGAFAEYVRIPGDAVLRGNLMLLPEGVTPAEAAVIEPLSCAYNGFTKCFVQPGDYALIVGAGPIGSSHAMLLHMAGASVLMNDLSQDRLDQCKQIMPYIETYCGDNLAGFVKEWTRGRGLDIAITACPVPQVQSAMIPLMNYGGRVNFFGGIPANKQPVPIDTNIVHYKELYLTGSTRSSIAQFRKTLEFVSQGLLNVESMISHRYGLKDILTGFENARQAMGIKHVIEFGK
ncbi:MAG: alcohol dehydrogenase catalytic domain-containing protein [Clostridiaceae bacterium]|nr:alcohol dehydrogenase catalytic domain-containing protein [Clostridiaceae bacterium]